MRVLKPRGSLQVRFVQPPHPDWTPGTSQPLPYPGNYIALDPAELGGSACYPLVISAIVPRPVGFLGTKSAAGAVNLSPYSYFGAMGHDPPLVAPFPVTTSSRNACVHIWTAHQLCSSQISHLDSSPAAHAPCWQAAAAFAW